MDKHINRYFTTLNDFLFELEDLIIKSINENPVITKNRINIKIPRDESVAKV